MNIKITDLDMILNYLETTSLEPHDDYSSEFTYKDQKILYKYIKQLQQENKKQKEVINKIEEKIKENIKNAKYEITTLTITDKLYYKYIDDMLNELLQILEDKEVK